MKLKRRTLTKEEEIGNNKVAFTAALFFSFAFLIACFFGTSIESNVKSFYIFLIICFVGIYKLLVKKYININKFFIAAFFSFAIFPMSHNLLYTYSEESYVFNQEYLDYKKREIKQKLESFNDVKTIASILKYIPYKILHSTVDDQYCDKWIYFKKNSIKVESIETKRPASRLIMIAKRLSFYDFNSNFLGQLDVVDETIYDAYLRKLDSRNNLLKELNFPESNIDYADIWLDSVTVFAFSNIKPISRLSQFIQVLQVISLFFTVHILTAFLDEYGGIKIKKKNHSVRSGLE